MTSIEELTERLKQKVADGMIDFDLCKDPGWNDLTEEQRAREILNFMDAPTVPDHELFPNRKFF